MVQVIVLLRFMLRYEELEKAKRQKRQEEQQAQLNANLHKALTQSYSMATIARQRSTASGNVAVC